MEENNKKIRVKLATVIVLVFIVAITIVGIIFSILNRNNDNKSININGNNTLKVEDTGLENEIGNPNKDRKNTDISVYDLKLPDDFVSDKIAQCTNYQLLGGIKYSVENAEEAVNYIRTSYEKYDAKNSELLKLELVDDEDFYYSVFKAYKNNNNDVTYENTYIFFKRDIIDIDNKKINLNKINDKDIIKTIFNTYNYVYHYENGSYKIDNSKIVENNNEYIYIIYFYEIVYGDWGLNDKITYYQQNIIINKKDGTYIFKDKERIDEFDGNYNPNPMVD